MRRRRHRDDDAFAHRFRLRALALAGGGGGRGGALAHAGLVDRDQLAAYRRTHGALRGVRQVDRVIELVDPRSESPMETRVRVLLVLSGLPRPEAQLVIEDASGRFVARADLGYREQRLVVEYDGAFHWEQRRADDRRRDAMRALGWTVIVVSRDDYYETPYAIVGKVRSALAARAA